MATNKVIYAGRTLIDLTGDTVDPEHLAEGYTAHDKSGDAIVGTMTGGADHTAEDGILTGNLEGVYVNTRIQSLRKYAFYNAEKITELSLPAVTEMTSNAIDGCSMLTKLSIPRLDSMGQTSVINCVKLEEIDTSNLRNCNGNFSSLAGLKHILLRKESVCSRSVAASYDPPNPEIKIYVPRALVESYKIKQGWDRFESRIRAIEDFTTDGTIDGPFDPDKPQNLRALSITGKNSINTYVGQTAQLGVEYDPIETGTDQRGVVWSVSGNATINQNGLVTLSDASVGDVLTITVTSAHDPTISATHTILVTYAETSCTIDLGDGQWIDTGERIADSPVYKSDAGSYHIANGQSVATINVVGYTAITIYIRSYAESSYDYTEAFPIDTTPVRAKGTYTTKGKQSATAYTECNYQLDGNEHTIAVMYSKDSSQDKDDDRGYFYVVPGGA